MLKLSGGPSQTAADAAARASYARKKSAQDQVSAYRGNSKMVPNFMTHIVNDKLSGSSGSFAHVKPRGALLMESASSIRSPTLVFRRVRWRQSAEILPELRGLLGKRFVIPSSLPVLSS